eukprot:TRINITY_DN6033_c0_g1_i1.p1 TRINITY_DN6033_c0_g1~~TRINITY_DN6033_c0_g1_i1.p1  ORF type:complete len:358 (-),score=96.05 TRINITY_DN6033_c0_g1_i1:62-1135(-)
MKITADKVCVGLLVVFAVLLVFSQTLFTSMPIVSLKVGQFYKPVPITIAEEVNNGSAAAAVGDNNDAPFPTIMPRYVVALTRTTHPFHLAVPAKENDGVRHEIYETGVYYERRLTHIVETIMTMTEPDKLPIIDVGANIGWVTYLAASFGREAWAFEADGRSRAYLDMTRAINPAFRDLVHSVPHPVSDVEGKEVFFRLHQFNPGQSEISNRATSETYNVTTVTLDGELPFQRYALLKVDTEGHEDFVLRGARKLLSNGMISYLHLEWVNPNEGVLKDLFAWGYRPVEAEHIESDFWKASAREPCTDEARLYTECLTILLNHFAGSENVNRFNFNMMLKFKSAQDLPPHVGIVPRSN